MTGSQPTIQGLTTAQKALCELLWSCDSKEQAVEFITGLPPELRTQAESLAIILIHECLEQHLDLFEEDAREVIAFISDR